MKLGLILSCQLSCHIFFAGRGGGGTAIGGRTSCRNVPVKNNANRLLFQKAKYIHLFSIPLVMSSSILDQEKKRNYNLYFPKYQTTASRSRQPNQFRLWVSCLRVRVYTFASLECPTLVNLYIERKPFT